MELPKPVIVRADGKITAKYNIALDLDGDAKNSVAAGVFIEIDEKEAISEALKKLIESGKLPDWLKKLLGVG